MTKAPPKPSENTKIIMIPYPSLPMDTPAKRTANAEGQGIKPPEKANQNAWPVVLVW